MSLNIAQRIIIRAIERYQQSGGGSENFRVDCNFYPSCSEYAKQATESHGAIRGTRMAFKRLRRCSDPDLVEKIPDAVPSRTVPSNTVPSK